MAFCVATMIALIYFGFSLTHDLVLPIWKSNVSITLMIEKKAKRYVPESCNAKPIRPDFLKRVEPAGVWGGYHHGGP
jgi:hypothetical protein